MTLIPIVLFVLAIGGPMAIAITAIISEQRRRQKRYEAMVRAIELGKSPEEVKVMFLEDKVCKDEKTNLRRGIILIGIAFGLAGMSLALHGFHLFGVLGGSGLLGVAILLLCLGIAFIVLWFATKPKA